MAKGLPSNESEIVAALNEVAKLLIIVAKRGTTQTGLIQEMDALGFEPKRIAELLGTTPNTVSVTLHSLRRKATKPEG